MAEHGTDRSAQIIILVISIELLEFINRKKFDNMRIMSGITDKYATFAIGGMIAHRIISMIDVLYLQGIQ